MPNAEIFMWSFGWLGLEQTLERSIIGRRVNELAACVLVGATLCLLLVGCGLGGATGESADNDSGATHDVGGTSPDEEQDGAEDEGTSEGEEEGDLTDGEVVPGEQDPPPSPEVLDRDGDLVADDEDNCAQIANRSQTDSDSDGVGDACDDDDDGDGFRDADDPDALDADRPGDFSTPESILDHPVIRNAIAELADQGFSPNFHRGSMPPDITGRYVFEFLTGTFVATGNGADVGVGNAEDVVSISATIDNTISVAGHGVDGGQEYAAAGFVRGEGRSFTTYSTGRTICTEDGSHYVTFPVCINSATFDQERRDWVDYYEFCVTVDVQGRLTSECAEMRAGDTEYTGGWQLLYFERVYRD